MTLNSSGAISLGGSTTGQSINLELSQSATAQISLNDTNVRTLAGVSSGQISMSSFYGKSSSTLLTTQTYTTNGYHSYTIPSGGNRIVVTVIGGGGGGAAASTYMVFENTTGCGGVEIYDTYPMAGAGGASGGAAKASFSVYPGLVLQVTVGNGGSPGNTAGGGNANGGSGTYSSVSYEEDLYLEPPGEPAGIYTVQTIFLQANPGGPGYWNVGSFSYGEPQPCGYEFSEPALGVGGGAFVGNSLSSENGNRFIVGSYSFSNGQSGSLPVISNPSYTGGAGASRTSFNGLSGTGGAGGFAAAGSAGTLYGAGGGGGSWYYGYYGGGLGSKGAVKIEVYSS